MKLNHHHVHIKLAIHLMRIFIVFRVQFFSLLSVLMQKKKKDVGIVNINGIDYYILLGNLRFCEYWCDLVWETSQPPNAFAPQRKLLSGGRSYPGMKKGRIWFPSFQQPSHFWLILFSLQRFRCRCWMSVNEEKGRIKLSWFRLKLSIQHRRVRDIRYIPRALGCCCLRFEEARTRVHARLFRADCCLSYFCWNVTKMSLIAVAAALLFHPRTQQLGRWGIRKLDGETPRIDRNIFWLFHFK